MSSLAVFLSSDTEVTVTDLARIVQEYFDRERVGKGATVHQATGDGATLRELIRECRFLSNELLCDGVNNPQCTCNGCCVKRKLHDAIVKAEGTS